MGHLEIFSWAMGWPNIICCTMGQLNIFSRAMSCLKIISCSMGQLKIFIWVKGWLKIFSCSMGQINIFSCTICQLKIFSCHSCLSRSCSNRSKQIGISSRSSGYSRSSAVAAAAAAWTATIVATPAAATVYCSQRSRHLVCTYKCSIMLRTNQYNNPSPNGNLKTLLTANWLKKNTFIILFIYGSI